MMKYLNEKLEVLNRYQIFYVVFLLSLMSSIASYIYFSLAQNLLYADAISRLDISRKVIDNITPGFAQLGNVWLPLPQILMLPFIWSKYMWHSGLAGALMSMPAYILGGVFVYKSSKIVSGSFWASFFAMCIYALNINLLYLQTTAMSESLFVCTLAVSIYYFLLFFKTRISLYLIPAGIAMSCMTLTRYEGLAMLIPSIPMVYFFTLITYRKHTKAESNTILYGMIAILGFSLWTLYLTAIFGDPLYWKNYYADAATTSTGAQVYSQAKPFLAAVWQYTTSTVWMVGLIPFILAMIGIVVMIIKSIKDKSWYFLPMLMPLSIFLFMVLTLQRNTPIVQPSLNWESILSPKTSSGTGFNIRYGLLLLPWVAIMTSYVFNVRYFLLKLFIFTLFFVQLFSYAQPKYSVIYQIPARMYGKPHASMVEWMKKNYDGGYILISASSHEDQMFGMGFDYRTYIHEGTRKYWKESLDDPPRYAKWVVLDKGHSLDLVARKRGIRTVLQRDYNKVYDKEQVEIYKIKGKVYFDIK